MRILICGSRNYNSVQNIMEYLERTPLGPGETTIVHGAARGADSIAGELAESMGFNVEPHPADWDKYGRSAGIRRNIEMLSTGIDHVVYFSKDLENSKGTSHMVRIAREAGVPAFDGEGSALNIAPGTLKGQR